MAEHGYRTALIVGVGSGVSAPLARPFNKAGMKVALAARRAGNLADLAKETGAMALACDATDAGQVTKLFAQLDERFGAGGRRIQRQLPHPGNVRHPRS